MRFAHLVVIALIGAVVLSTFRPGAAAADPEELFEQLVQFVNAGDVASAVDLFAENAVLEVQGPGSGGPCPGGQCAGREAIQNQLQGQVTAGHELRLVESEVSGNLLAGSYELRSDQTMARGVERIVFNFTLEESDGQISLFTFTPDLTDPATASFFERASQMRPPATGDGGLASRK